MGTVQLRNELVRPRLTSFTLRVNADGTPATDDFDVSTSLGTLTLETALFPFLFPFASGAFNGAISLCSYLQWRMHCFFSVFTLHKLYLLMMFQLRRAVVLSTTFKHSQLEKSICKFKGLNPTASEEEIYKNVLKYDVPGTLPGSPQWHKGQLQDLLAMVAQWGMPTFVLTLTADEISSMCWTEIDDIEALLNKVNKDFSWRDAPVECAALFHAKVQSFMRNFILGDEDGLLGKVLHYVIRYEEQNRGSLHAHIILWVEPSHADRVANKISAAIPAQWDDLRGEFVEPTNPELRLLFQLVSQKN